MPTAARKIVLTDRSLKALKPSPEGKRLVLWDALMPGMVVRVSALGKRSFYAVKRRAGDEQPTWHQLGAYPVMSLSEARVAAREALNALIEGQHPKRLSETKRREAEEKRRATEASTFRAVAEAFMRQYLPRTKPSTARLYELYFRRELIPAFGAQAVAGIRRRDVIALVEGVEQRSGKASALGALSVLRKCLNWSLARDLPGYEANPAASIRAADLLGPTKARDRLISDPELVSIWRAIPEVGPPFAAVYKLLLLCGARYREIAEAQWSYLDLYAETLLVPPERAKNGEAMLIPLPPLAVELLKAVPRFTGPFIFGVATAGQRPPGAFSGAKARLDKALAEQGANVGKFVIHDFRRVVRSGLGRLGIPPVVAEMCLGHRQSGIPGVYDRHSYLSERRDALLRWEKHLLGIVVQGPGKVVSIGTRASA